MGCCGSRHHGDACCFCGDGDLVEDCSSFFCKALVSIVCLPVIVIFGIVFGVVLLTHCNHLSPHHHHSVGLGVPIIVIAIVFLPICCCLMCCTVWRGPRGNSRLHFGEHLPLSTSIPGMPAYGGASPCPTRFPVTHPVYAPGYGPTAAAGHPPVGYPPDVACGHGAQPAINPTCQPNIAGGEGGSSAKLSCQQQHPPAFNPNYRPPGS